MKAILVISALLLFSFCSNGQITSPIIRAGFGVDADLLRNYFNNAPVSSNDDWFHYTASEDIDGDFVIDTSGAAAIYNGYGTSPGTKFNSFVRGMRYPLLSTINNHIYYDAVFIRDFHGTDSTSFSGGSKNGQSPADWITAISPVLAKNDIVDGYLHVRRDGLQAGDSLWFFGAVAILGTNGDRYFDFELYQTDITYNRGTKKFENYGPEAGHTSWQFAADGSTNKVGDIIFTAEYGNAGLSLIEARIWVQKTAISSVTPQAFSWTGSFDGDGSGALYGYAGIVPKTGGAFYQGLQNTAAVSTGPFGTIKTGDIASLTYDPVQFMEFSVNLTKLGLDPMSFTTGSMCNLAFGKVLIKTRTSTSFTASITDFASPFSFRAVPEVDLSADIPLFCDEQNIATIQVLNPLPTSTYTFTSTDGHILLTGATSIVVDSPGVYIVIQTLLDGCAEGGRDTVVITRAPDNSCVPLAIQPVAISAVSEGPYIKTTIEINGNAGISDMILQRMSAGNQFTDVHQFRKSDFPDGKTAFTFIDKEIDQAPVQYYRALITETSGYWYYSRTIAVRRSAQSTMAVRLFPNPAKPGTSVQLEVSTAKPGKANIRITAVSGMMLSQQSVLLQAGLNRVRITVPFPATASGLYLIAVSAGDQSLPVRLQVQ